MLVGGEQGGIVEGHILGHLPRLPALLQLLRLKNQLLDLVVHDDQRHRFDDKGAVAAHVGAFGGAAADLVDEGGDLVVLLVLDGGGTGGPLVTWDSADNVAVARRGEFAAEDLAHHGTASEKEDKLTQ